MSDLTKGLLTVLVAVVLASTAVVLVNFLLGTHIPAYWAALGSAVFGLGYGLQAGILGIYNLTGLKGWVELVVDMTWSLPNTIFGFIFANCIYLLRNDL